MFGASIGTILVTLVFRDLFAAEPEVNMDAIDAPIAPLGAPAVEPRINFLNRIQNRRQHIPIIPNDEVLDDDNIDDVINQVNANENQPEIVLAEIFGLTGNPFTVFLSVGIFLSLGAAFICIFIWFPYRLGKLVSIVISSLSHSVYPQVSNKLNTFFDVLIDKAFGILDIQSVPNEIVANEIISTAELKANVITPPAYLGIGYLVILNLFVIFTKSYRATQPNLVAAMNEIKSFFKVTLRMTKLTLFLHIEMLFFPFMCGCIMDVCLLPLLSTAHSIESRLAFLDKSPYAFKFLHWLAGTYFLTGSYLQAHFSCINLQIMSQSCGKYADQECYGLCATQMTLNSIQFMISCTNPFFFKYKNFSKEHFSTLQFFLLG